MKKKCYKKSSYLESVTDIDVHKKFTKLRIGCSNLGSHKFYTLKKDNCVHCENCNEDVSHFLLHCKGYETIRNNFLAEVNKDFSIFKDLSNIQKILSILSLKLPIFGCNDKTSKFVNLCIGYINDLFQVRFFSMNTKG